MPGLENVTYRPLVGSLPLDLWSWHAGGSDELGGLFRLPQHLPDGPVAAFVQDALVAVIGRSEDFSPFSMIVRDDGMTRKDASITIRSGSGLKVRSEKSPARPAFIGHGGKPETDLLIVEGAGGLLVQLG
jgi:hypothetical protein